MEKMGYKSDDLVYGIDRSGHRALLYSLGVSRDELNKPFIAIVNSWNEIVPGCVPLKEIAQFAKRGVLEAGGLPFEFCTIGVCDGLAQGHKGMSYSLPSREVIADSIEIMLKAHCFDGAVFLGSCDKITPAMLMAAVRVNIPSIFVQCGPMLHGSYEGKDLSLPSLREYAGKFFAGLIDEKELHHLEHVTMPTCGSCAMLGTANTMSCVAEALGLAQPMSATTPPFFSQKKREARQAGLRIIKLVKEQLRPLDIVTKHSVENALRVGYAIGASTNLALHIKAIADEADLSLGLEEMDQISASTPYIVKLQPSGEMPFDVLNTAGGIPAVMKSLGHLINQKERSITGTTVGEIMDNALWPNKELIRPPDRAYSERGSFKALWGNLAPGGAVVKLSGVVPEMYQHSGPAIVFENMEDAVLAVEANSINKGSVIVIRNEGPIGGPGMREMQLVTSLMAGTALTDTTALITDGRFSGATRGPCIGHISPEAAEGGPIAYVKDGDIISIDLNKGSLDFNVTLEEMEQRKTRHKEVDKERHPNGVLGSYIYQIKQKGKDI